ncbi:MAG: hypothetical protein S0880_27420 [Actinomycetota bacterium]|nr:hypothetical protein [Actinomycetota bacterium]
MAKRRVAIGLDEDLLGRAMVASGSTLNATIEAGLRLLIAGVDRDLTVATDPIDRRVAAATDAIGAEATVTSLTGDRDDGLGALTAPTST